MPYTESQHRLFEAAAHDSKIAQQHGMSQQKAAQMASEGVKKSDKKRQMLAQALRKK